MWDLGDIRIYPFWNRMDRPGKSEIIGQMLRKLMLYPPQKFRFIGDCPCHPKTDKCEYLPHRTF